MNRRVKLTPGRRMMADLSWASRRVPRYLIRGPLVIPRAMAARAALPAPRPPWTVIFAKAYAMAAQQRPSLRRVHAALPWPHMIEAPHAQGSVIVERVEPGEVLLAPARLFIAHDTPLPELAQRIEQVKHGPRGQAPALRWMLGLAALPWPLRRAAYALALALGWPVLRLGGNYAISVLGEHGVEVIDSVSIVPVFFSFGPIAPDGTVFLHFAVDHRVLDGSDAIFAMRAMQAALEGPLAEEMAALLDAPPGGV